MQNAKSDLLILCKLVGKYFDLFSVWISKLSWGKFILFIILTIFISNEIQELIFLRKDNNWLDALTIIFILVSIGMKTLITSKVKAEIRAHDALELADAESLSRQLSDAKIQMLQAQIEPHFLFNTLASLQYLIEADPKTANKILMHLVTYLRYALPQIRENKPISTLTREIENISAYLNIMKIRIGDNLKIELNIPTELEPKEFPSMMLQPIVENAIKYGIEESIHGGVIKVSAYRDNDYLYVCVSNTGNLNVISEINQITFKNINDRLEHLYPKKSSLTIDKNVDSFIITLKTPLV